MDEKSAVAQCAHCRADVAVPDSYAHGDHIRCGTCSTSHRIQRGEALRLVLADVTPLKDALQDTQQRLGRLEDELAGARGRLGIGMHGLYVGVAYLLYSVHQGELLSAALAFKTLAVIVVCAVVLETLNFFFLAKRQRIERLSGEIDELKREAVALRHKLREASRR